MVSGQRYTLLYTPSPLQVYRKMQIVYEMVSCMKQLGAQFALRICHYACISLGSHHKRQALNYVQL